MLLLIKCFIKETFRQTKSLPQHHALRKIDRSTNEKSAVHIMANRSARRTETKYSGWMYYSLNERKIEDNEEKCMHSNER